MAEEQKNDVQKFRETNPETFEFIQSTPPEIVDFLLARETSEKIANICEKNGVSEEKKIEGVASRVAWVIFGGLPSGNLAMTLELGLNLAPEIAKKVADEANQFISSSIINLKSGEPAPPERETPQKPPSKDVYREQI